MVLSLCSCNDVSSQSIATTSDTTASVTNSVSDFDSNEIEVKSSTESEIEYTSSKDDTLTSSNTLSSALSSNSSTSDTSSNSDNKFNVDRKDTIVEVTIPASWINDLEATTKAADENEDIVNYTVNDDGSITYEYKQEDYEELLESTRNQIDENIQSIVTEGKFACLVSINYDKSTFSDINIIVTSQSDYERGFNFLAVVAVQFNLVLYKAVLGDDEFTSIIHIIDSSNNNEFKTEVFPSDE